MAKRKTANQKRQELKSLAKGQKQGIFDMLAIADELLSDPKYVDKYGGEASLIADLESDEFSHFGGSPKLKQLIQAYRKNSDRSVWEEHDCNVWAMIDLAKPEKGEGKKERTDWRKRAKDAESRVEQLEGEIEQLKATIVQYEENNTHQRQRIEELLSQLGELKGQITQLEKQNGREAVAV